MLFNYLQSRVAVEELFPYSEDVTEDADLIELFLYQDLTEKGPDLNTAYLNALQLEQIAIVRAEDQDYRKLWSEATAAPVAQQPIPPAAPVHAVLRTSTHTRQSLLPPVDGSMDLPRLVEAEEIGLDLEDDNADTEANVVQQEQLATQAEDFDRPGEQVVQSQPPHEAAAKAATAREIIIFSSEFSSSSRSTSSAGQHISTAAQTQKEVKRTSDTSEAAHRGSVQTTKIGRSSTHAPKQVASTPQLPSQRHAVSSRPRERPITPVSRIPTLGGNLPSLPHRPKSIKYRMVPSVSDAMSPKSQPSPTPVRTDPSAKQRLASIAPTTSGFVDVYTRLYAAAKKKSVTTAAKSSKLSAPTRGPTSKTPELGSPLARLVRSPVDTRRVSTPSNDPRTRILTRMASEYKHHVDYKELWTDSRQDMDQLVILVSRVFGLSSQNARYFVTREYAYYWPDGFTEYVVHPNQFHLGSTLVALLNNYGLDERQIIGLEPRIAIIQTENLLFRKLKQDNADLSRALGLARRHASRTLERKMDEERVEYERIVSRSRRGATGHSSPAIKSAGQKGLSRPQRGGSLRREG